MWTSRPIQNYGGVYRDYPSVALAQKLPQSLPVNQPPAALVPVIIESVPVATVSRVPWTKLPQSLAVTNPVNVAVPFPAPTPYPWPVANRGLVHWQAMPQDLPVVQPPPALFDPKRWQWQPGTMTPPSPVMIVQTDGGEEGTPIAYLPPVTWPIQFYQPVFPSEIYAPRPILSVTNPVNIPVPFPTPLQWWMGKPPFYPYLAPVIQPVFQPPAVPFPALPTLAIAFFEAPYPFVQLAPRPVQPIAAAVAPPALLGPLGLWTPGMMGGRPFFPPLRLPTPVQDNPLVAGLEPSWPLALFAPKLSNSFFAPRLLLPIVEAPYIILPLFVTIGGPGPWKYTFAIGDGPYAARYRFTLGDA